MLKSYKINSRVSTSCTWMYKIVFSIVSALHRRVWKIRRHNKPRGLPRFQVAPHPLRETILLVPLFASLESSASSQEHEIYFASASKKNKLVHNRGGQSPQQWLATRKLFFHIICRPASSKEDMYSLQRCTLRIGCCGSGLWNLEIENSYFRRFTGTTSHFQFEYVMEWKVWFTTDFNWRIFSLRCTIMEFLLGLCYPRSKHRSCRVAAFRCRSAMLVSNLHEIRTLKGIGFRQAGCGPGRRGEEDEWKLGKIWCALAFFLPSLLRLTKDLGGLDETQTPGNLILCTTISC